MVLLFLDQNLYFFLQLYDFLDIHHEHNFCHFKLLSFDGSVFKDLSQTLFVVYMFSLGNIADHDSVVCRSGVIGVDFCVDFDLRFPEKDQHHHQNYGSNQV